MPRTVTCRILDQADGRFAVVAVLEPGRVYRRDDLATRDAAEAWIEGLRVLMAACAAPLVRAEAEAGTGAGRGAEADASSALSARPHRL